MILLDSSSSMSEKSFNLATETAFNILDTLGENDYVNLITFSEVVKSPVPCFKDRMIKANPDNIHEIKSAVKAIVPQNEANFTAGLEYAFSLLHKVNYNSVKTKQKLLYYYNKILYYSCSIINREKEVNVIRQLC